MLMVQALMGPPWAFHAGDVAYIHSDETHDLSFTAMRLHEKFGLDIDTIPYGCRRNVSRHSWLVQPAGVGMTMSQLSASREWQPLKPALTSVLLHHAHR